jgi:hypothetical protein
MQKLVRDKRGELPQIVATDVSRPHVPKGGRDVRWRRPPAVAERSVLDLLTSECHGRNRD